MIKTILTIAITAVIEECIKTKCDIGVKNAKRYKKNSRKKYKR